MAQDGITRRMEVALGPEGRTASLDGKVVHDLQEYFSQAGAISTVNLMMDKFTGQSRGFAFIEYASQEEANKAVEMFHEKEFQGRPLTVNIARPREERAPRPGGDRRER